MGWYENHKDADVDEGDDGCNAPFDTGRSCPVGDDDREAIYDELEYEMDLRWSECMFHHGEGNSLLQGPRKTLRKQTR